MQFLSQGGVGKGTGAPEDRAGLYLHCWQLAVVLWPVCPWQVPGGWQL